jgi:carboxypeptidase Q
MRRPILATALLPASLLLAALPAGSLLAADEKIDLAAITRIRDEAFNRSKAQETLSKLTDEIGPRLTGSPNYRRAAEWAKQQFEAWGLSGARIEPVPFGRGWVLERVAVHMIAPDTAPMEAYPKAWTPGTDGPKRGAAVYAKLEKEEDFAGWKGKLEGKIVLTAEPPEVKPREKADATRLTKNELEGIFRFEPGGRGRFSPAEREKMLKQRQLAKKIAAFLLVEKALAWVDASKGDDGTIFVQGGGGWKKDDPPAPVSLAVGAESYGRIVRLLTRKVPVELEIDVKVRFIEEDPLASANVLAEIPGTDRKDEIVLLGAHLDSWHAGTGATDNAAGVAAVMEAARVLKASGLRPRRTIRFALWAGEEQGYLGSRAYVTSYLASRPEPKEKPTDDVPDFLRRPTGPLTFKPAYAKLAVYFNLDNGGGKIRGIFTQENAEVAPIFEAWLAPFRDTGATTVTMKRTGGTDHQSFDGVGLPGFQFLQDELDYMTRTHHSNMDVYERVPKGDLMQASAVMASFAWHAAQRDQMLPRKPVPPGPPAEPKQDEAKPAEASPAK